MGKGLAVRPGNYTDNWVRIPTISGSHSTILQEIYIVQLANFSSVSRRCRTLARFIELAAYSTL